MKIKRIMAAFTAAVCFSTVFSGFPCFDLAFTAEAAVNDSFERTYDGWCAYGTADIKTADGFEGRGMLITDRASALDGAVSEKGFYLDGGIKYKYSVKVKSEKGDVFSLTLRWLDPETGEYNSRVIAEKSANANEWTEISAKAAAPKGSINQTLIITANSTEDFYFDDVNITEKSGIKTVYAAASDKGLKDEFAAYFKVGTAVPANLMTNSKATAILLKDFNSVTCENELKPDATLVQWKSDGTNVGVQIGSGAASIMKFCSDNHIGMRGHTMVWYSQTPEWFFKEGYNASNGYVSESVMDKRMESYIKNMFALIKEQYPDLDLYCYDICNECVSDNSNNTKKAAFNSNGTFNYGGARDAGYGSGKSPWVQIYGDNHFMEKAYTYARKYAPTGCKLFYNDYNEYWDHKRDCIYTTCKYLYDKGLLDGIGMQSHIAADGATGFTGINNYRTALQKYAGIGCEVQITELDIDIKTDNATYTSTQQAEKYKAIFDAAMNINKGSYKGKVTALCVWGIDDAHSWVNMNENVGSDPLLYDSSFTPKEAYNTVAAMIPASEWGGSTAEEPNQYGWYFDSSFESDVNGWTNRGSTTLSLSSDEHFVGSSSLYVTGRTSTWNGAQKALSTATYKPDTEYSFSVNAKYTSGNATEPIALKLQYKGSDGKTHYSTVSEVTAFKGEWIQLANKNYTIPAGASDLYLYVETGETTCDFYIDEAIAAIAGTTIIGAESSTVILGDADLDKVITSADLLIIKQAAEGGSVTGKAKQAADVNGDNIIDNTDAELVMRFITGEITEFPTAVQQTDTAAMEALFSGVTPTSSLKSTSEGNPLMTQRFGADPGVMEYNGRVYVYMTNDVLEYDGSGNITKNTFSQINKLSCISSDDMVNWTDHGIINAAGSGGAASWATCSWAPCAAHKTINGKEKFFLYFCNGGNGICVLTSDSPTGPWTSPLNGPLVSRSTPNCSTVTWLFDPAVTVDNDGTGYLCFGGGVPSGKESNPGTARIVKLGNDMISLDGTPKTLEPPYLFEDSGINRIGNTYFYTYCSNFSTSGNSYGMGGGAIQYMTASSPLGPYTYAGQVLSGTYAIDGRGGNNHHSIVQLGGKTYIFYHTRLMESLYNIAADKGGYRSPMVNEITVSGSKITGITGNRTGVSALKTLDPYSRVRASAIYRQGGINTRGTGDTIVTDIQKGDWTGVKGANFSKGAKTLTVKVSSSKGAAIKICKGSEKGSVLGYVDIPATNGFTDITVPVENINGVNDIYFVFGGELEFDSWYFE